MDTSYSAEQEAFRDSLRRYLAEKCDQGFARKQWQQAIPHTDELWSKLVELGITALLIPEQYGGLGMTMTDMGIVMEELGRRVNVAPVLSSAVFASSLAVCIDDKEILPQLADGSALATVAFEEDSISLLNYVQPTLQAKNNQLNGTKVRVAPFVACTKKGRVAPLDKIVSQYYVRLSVVDKPCVLAKITAIFAAAKIGIASVIQPEGHEGESVPLILMLHEAPNAAMQKALAKIAKLPAVKAKPVMFRVENLK